MGRGKKNEARYRSQSADRYLEENVRDYPVDMYGGQHPPPLEGYPLSSPGYAPPYSQSVVGAGYPRNPPGMGTNPRASRPPSQGQMPPNMPLAKGKAPKGMAVSKYQPWDPRWEKDHQKLLKRHQAEQQKLLKEQQKEAQKQLKIQREQLKVQEPQMRRIQEDQMRQFQEQQKHLQEEQDKQLKLLQQYADLQQQQQQPMQDQAGIPGYLESQPMPVYDLSTLGTLNLDYSTLGTLAYGTNPGTDQTTAALNAAYANAYWTMLYQQNPYLLANYTLPRIQPAAEEMKRERGQKGQGRARYRKNRHSKEATLITEDNRRYKSNPDSESSELFISGGSEEDRENADDFKNQLLAQKNKLKKMEEAPKGEEREEEEEGKRRAKSPKNQPIFMAELQKKLKDKQQKNQQLKKAPAPPVPIPAEDIYGIYGYVPGAPVPVPIGPVPPPPVIAPYIAPGAPQLMVPPTNTEDMEAVKLMSNMDINPPQNNTTGTEGGPVLPLAQRNDTNEDIYDDGKSAIYAVPQKKRNVQPKPPVKEEDDYEEQASGLIIDDVMDDMEAETGVVDINKKQLIKIEVPPDDMVSAVYTADKDGTETIYATNDDIFTAAVGEVAPLEHEEEANMFLNDEDPPPRRGAAELGVWREDHGTTRNPPPSYFAYSPDEEQPMGPYQPQNRAPPGNRRYNKKGNRGPQRRPNNKRVIRMNNANQNPDRYPVQQPRRRNSNCTIQ